MEQRGGLGQLSPKPFQPRTMLCCLAWLWGDILLTVVTGLFFPVYQRFLVTHGGQEILPNNLAIQRFLFSFLLADQCTRTYTHLLSQSGSLCSGWSVRSLLRFWLGPGRYTWYLASALTLGRWYFWTSEWSNCALHYPARMTNTSKD